MKGLLLLLTAFATASGIAQPTSADKLDQYMRAQVDATNFNGNVLVAKNGNLIYQKAFGYANYSTKAPLDLNSLFDLGSVSKQFTAMSILLLKEQGKLSLSDSLRKFFPDLPYSGITIRHLLTHTAGLPDYEEAMEAAWNHKKVAFNADMIQVLAQKKTRPYFQPGQKWKYSNTGYAMLASIVEKASGQPFAQFTAQRIFKPLGMGRSRIYNTRRSTTEVIPDYAYGYVFAESLKRYILPDSLPQFDFVYYLDGIVGDGTVNSTVDDLLKWDRALKNHTLLSEASQRDMLTGQVLSDTVNKGYYGYGVGISRDDRGDIVSHSGGWPGYTSHLIRYVSDDITVVVLSNNESDSPRISRALGDIVVGKSVTLPRKRNIISLTSTALDAYLGVYAGPYGPYSNAIFTVTREDNQLFEQRTGGLKRKIFPETETQFFYREIDMQLEFVRDASGKVVKQRITADGKTWEVMKIN